MNHNETHGSAVTFQYDTGEYHGKYLREPKGKPSNAWRFRIKETGETYTEADVSLTHMEARRNAIRHFRNVLAAGEYTVMTLA